MTQIQWGQNSVLGDPDLMMMGVPALESIGQSDFDSIFNAYPEFGTFVIQNGRPDLILTAQQSGALLAQSTDNYQTMLNPDNIRAFMNGVLEGEFANLQTRYGFRDQDQCQFFYNYLIYLVENSLLDNGPIENIAMGGLVERTLNQTYAALSRTFHLETVVRNLAMTINASTGQLSCDYYVQQVDSTNYKTVCQPYDFSNVTQIKAFVNATWYKNDTSKDIGGYYTDVLHNNTGLTYDQLTQLFDT